MIQIMIFEFINCSSVCFFCSKVVVSLIFYFFKKLIILFSKNALLDQKFVISQN